MTSLASLWHTLLLGYAIQGFTVQSVEYWALTIHNLPEGQRGLTCFHDFLIFFNFVMCHIMFRGKMHGTCFRCVPNYAIRISICAIPHNALE